MLARPIDLEGVPLFTGADGRQERLRLFGVCIFLSQDHPCKYLGQVDLDVVGYEVALHSMPITHSHHPLITNTREIVKHDISVLIWLLLPRYVPLPRFDRVVDYWTCLTLRPLIIILVDNVNWCF